MQKIDEGRDYRSLKVAIAGNSYSLPSLRQILRFGPERVCGRGSENCLYFKPTRPDGD